MSDLKVISHCAPTAPSTTLWSQLRVTVIMLAMLYLGGEEGRREREAGEGGEREGEREEGEDGEREGGEDGEREGGGITVNVCQIPIYSKVK